MASTQPQEQYELALVIAAELEKPEPLHGTKIERATPIAQAIVDAENVFVGADYVKNEREAGRTILAILSPDEAEQLQAWRIEKGTL